MCICVLWRLTMGMPARVLRFLTFFAASWALQLWCPAGTEKAIADIGRLAQENEVRQIVVGLPKNMDGTEGPRAALCREFAQKLGDAAGLEIALWDERRTTVEAHNILTQHNYHGKKRKNTVDAVAASLILEGYLAYLRR